MNRNLNLKIKESIQTKQLSKNLLLLCLACLHEKITYSERIEARLEKQRDIIAKAALENGIDRKEISQKIVTIHQKDYPKFKQITAVSDIIESGCYAFISGLIPTKGHIHFKTDEELKIDLERKPVKKKIDADSEGFYELCEYVEKQIVYDSLTEDIKKLLQKLKTKTYDYSFILQTFKFYHTDIEKAVQKNKPFESAYSKCQYVCGIIKKKLPEMDDRLQQQEKADEKIINMDFSELNDTGASYQRKTKDDCSKVLNVLW
ncbi:hypothetical protein [Roseburia sp. 1XD42-69]|jgi:hypothetical protein|uniref:hypothetical protein n=1 Tax=Roseburia sp. 1XD42-69 TaxID=2320088 RepID=UPI000EA2F79D|nr:hypothetical protein [Roseburia sp. 1XD42-69]RKJ60436.1 hypothetical protein D7Y06_23850 [Roseburia sp. 1XD42-69]